MSCLMRGCSNTRRQCKNSNIQFFNLPAIPAVRAKWIEACEPDLPLPKAPVICSIHFDASMIVISNSNSRRVLHNAVPMSYLGKRNARGSSDPNTSYMSSDKINRILANDQHFLPKYLRKLEASAIPIQAGSRKKPKHAWEDQATIQSPLELINEEVFDESMQTATTATYQTEESAKEKRTCGHIEVSRDTKTYTMVCQHCDENFAIWNWIKFVKHVKEAHDNLIKIVNKVQNSDVHKDKEEHVGLFVIENDVKPSVATVPLTKLQKIVPKVESSTSVPYLEEQVFVDTLKAVDFSDDDVLKPKRQPRKVKEQQTPKAVKEQQQISKAVKEQKPKVATEQQQTPKVATEQQQTPKLVTEQQQPNTPMIEPSAAETTASSIKSSTANNDLLKFDNMLFDGSSDSELSTFDENADYRNIIYINKTERAIVLDYLSLLRRYPILLDAVQAQGPKLEKIYKTALSVITSKINENWSRDMTEQSMRLSISLTKQWYRRATRLQQKKPDYIENVAALNGDFQHYLAVCKAFMLPTKRPAEKKRNTCAICQKQFRTPKNCRVHMLRHEAPKFKCQQCQRSYYTQCLLKQHMKLHANQRDYICEMCGKTFIRHKHLKEHRRYHNKDLWWQCKMCERKFGCFSGLYMHRKRAHEQQPSRPKRARHSEVAFTHDPATNRKRYVCDLCGSSFLWVGGLQRHQMDKHGFPRIRHRKAKSPKTDKNLSIENDSKSTKIHACDENNAAISPPNEIDDIECLLATEIFSEYI